jgi:hypothetical protein
MNGREIVEAFLREHTELREKLRECAAAQSQAADGNYGQCLHAVSVLRELCHLLEHEVAHHFREEETALYAFVQDRLPQLKPTVVEFQQEHDVIRQAFDEFRRELGQFNTSGELGVRKPSSTPSSSRNSKKPTGWPCAASSWMLRWRELDGSFPGKQPLSRQDYLCFLEDAP